MVIIKRSKYAQYLKRFGGTIIQTLPTFIVKYLLDKIIYKPRIKYLGLENNKVPLFDTVFFEVRTKCNGTCSFCAASIQNEIREDSTMPKNLYMKVVDELVELGFAGRIAYHVNSDPLIFSDLNNFIEYVRHKLPGAWIQILTNGKGLSEKKAESLLKAGINELTINDYNDELTTGMPVKFQRIYDNVLPRFYERHQIKTGHGPDTEKRNVFRFNVFRSKKNTTKTSRAGTSPNKKLQSGLQRGFCEYPFTQFNITTDGKVNKCCADLYFSDPMGNVKDNSMMHIWEGRRFRKVRQIILEGNRNAIETCRKCDFYGVKKVYSKGAKILRIITE